MKTRPFGVALIAILVAIEAILQILASLAMFGVSSFGLFITPYTGAAAALLIIASVALIIGVIELVVASGLWSMEKWAWIVAVAVTWIDLVFDVIGGFVNSQSWSAVFASIIIPVIVLIYLYQGGVQKAFNRN
ncbi:MAG: hypothetical protein M1338_03385 [Patescibacteria group bacterium]|nr:hypothetical protein [Patescibacteria group bacterium]